MARPSRILGPDGKPLDLDEIFGPPKAGPTLTGVRQPISGHPADGLTPRRLASIHKAAAQGDPLAWLELAEDIEERDPHYLAVLGTRRRQVAQLPITVEAVSDDEQHVLHANFIRDWLKEGVLDLALFDLLDAIGKGFCVMEIEWETTPASIHPRCLEYRPQRWFDFDPIDGETIQLAEGVTREPLSPQKFIVHRAKAKSGLTIRSGLARVASWSWMYKAFSAADWAIFTQNYGTPIRVGKFDRAATDADKEVLWRAVANIAGDCAAIIPAEMSIEMISLKDTGKSGELYEKRVDWLDRQISKLVLGQTTTTDAVSGGHAVAKEHRLVQEDIERSDEVGNHIDVRTRKSTEDTLPGTLAIAVATGIAGTGNPDVQPLLDAIANEWFTDIGMAWDDAANLGVLANDLVERYKAMGKKDAHAYVGHRGTYGELGTKGALTNCQHITPIGAKNAYQAPWEWAASACGLATFHLTNDPARQLRSLVLPGIDAPEPTDCFTETERDLLLRQGISTWNRLSDGSVVLERVVTAYKVSNLGVSDPAWLDIMVPKTLTRIRYDWSAYVSLMYPRHKLAPDDSVAANNNDVVVTPRRMHGSWGARCKLYERQAWIIDVSRTLEQSRFEIDESDKNRLNGQQRINIIGNLMVLAAALEFEA